MNERTNGGPDINGFGPRNRSTLRLILTIAAALVVVLGLYVLQPSWFAAPVAANPPASATPTPTPVPKPKPAPRQYYIGDGHRADGVWITPISVQYTPGSGANQANQGYTYAVVTLRIENHLTQDYTFNPNINCLQYCNFYVQDTLGEKIPPIEYDPYRTKVRAVVLQSLGHQVGSYTFEVPRGDARDHRLVLLWYHNPLVDPDTVFHWNLRPRGH